MVLNHVAGDRPAHKLQVAMLVSAINRYERVRERVRLLGPDLFEQEFEKAVVAELLQPGSARSYPLTSRQRANASRLIEEARSVDALCTEDWAMYLIKCQAEDRFRLLFGQCLQWGADALLDGQKLETVIEKLNDAAHVVLGLKPFDIHDPWGGIDHGK